MDDKYYNRIYLGDKKVKGYNSMNSGVIFIPKKYVGCWAHVVIKEMI